MKHLQIQIIGAVFVVALSSAAWAQRQDLEVTMEVVPANAGPDAVTGEIKLPETASPNAQDAAAFGLGVANKAREMKGELGRDFGQEVSQAARDRAQQRRSSTPAKR
jgi:hypothetical protein